MTRPYFAESEVPDDTVRYTDIHAGMNGTGMERLEALITFYTVHSEEETKAEWSEIIARINNKLLPLHMKVEEFEMCTRFFHFVETCECSKADTWNCSEQCADKNSQLCMVFSSYYSVIIVIV